MPPRPNKEVIDVESFRPEVEFVRRAPSTIDLCRPPEVIDLAGLDDDRRLQKVIRGVSKEKPKPEPIIVQKRRVSGNRHDGRAAKRRATSPAVTGRPTILEQQRLPSLHTTQPSQRKRKQTDRRMPGVLVAANEVVDLCSDSDDDLVNFKRARPKADGSDSEAEYENIHAGLDVTKSRNWQLLPERVVDDEDILPSFDALSLAPRSYSIKKIGYSSPLVVSGPAPSLRNDKGHPYLWTTLQHCALQPLKSLHALCVDFRYHALKMQSSFHSAAGSINKIDQHDYAIVACSATSLGNPDHDEDEEDRDEPSPYNKEGSLQIFYNGKAFGIDAHAQQWASHKKYYTVNDVKFDPHCPSRFISSGNDYSVCLWNCDNLYLDDDTLSPLVHLEHKIFYNHVPHDLHYKPGTSVLAVACQDGNVYIYPTEKSFKEDNGFSFSVAPAGSGQAAGSVVWGLQSTSHLLFASSEPYGDNSDGFHRAFDVNKQKLIYEFSAQEAGDGMALDSEGKRLALFTAGDSSSHTLHLYDVQKGNGKHPMHTIDLTPFQDDDEVTTASFSPDGIYLAVGRSDNATHVYDTRMLSQISHSFQHPESQCGNPGSGRYGIVETKWVETPNRRRLGLVTGGNDGCVRLWDVRKAAEDSTNGTVLAEADFNIGYFSLGDPFSREKPLVVGDCGGGIYIYDHDRRRH